MDSEMETWTMWTVLATLVCGLAIILLYKALGRVIRQLRPICRRLRDAWRETGQPHHAPVAKNGKNGPGQSKEEDRDMMKTKNGTGLQSKEQKLDGDSMDLCKSCWNTPKNPNEQTTHMEGATPAAACAPPGSFWPKSILKVYMNPAEIPKGWKFKRKDITVSVIRDIAKEWNTIEYVPMLKFSDAPDEKQGCDIRVEFSCSKGCESMIGTQAAQRKPTEPTMTLNLQGTDAYIQFVILHEFGHALGLGHEHQSPGFFKALKFFDVEKMKSDVKKKKNPNDWKPKKDEYSQASDYDPYSIMHYWLDNNWLKQKYRKPKYYELESKAVKKLSPPEKVVLEGIWKRVLGLPNEISKMDKTWVMGEYKRIHGENSPSSSGSGAANKPTQEDTILTKKDINCGRLMELLSEEAWRWELFLGQLGVSEEVKGQIKLDHAHKPEFAKLCLQSGLKYWVKTDPRPTYQRLSAVLRGSTVTNKPLALAVDEFVAQCMQGGAL